MSVFLLPLYMVKDIERLMNGFWWGCEGEGGRRVRWKAWDHLFVPKKWSGMGFRKLREFNLDMLSKQTAE